MKPFRRANGGRGSRADASGRAPAGERAAAREPAFSPGAAVAVLGLGRSGVAAARLAHARGGRVYASDAAAGPELEQAVAALRAEGIDAEVGRHDRARLLVADLAVTSPGIGPATEVRRDLRAAGVRTIAEIELAYRDLRSRIIGITGTNGKTTTTALTGFLLTEGGVSAATGGNIGHPLCELALLEEQPDWVVVELSSFQLADLERFTPDIGVLLNLSPDHLDRYRDVASYYEDKRRLFAGGRANSRWVLNADDPAVLELAREAQGGRWHFSLQGPVERGAYLDEGGQLRLVLDDEERAWASRDSLRLMGSHNVANALAGGLSATLAAGPALDVAGAMTRFEALPHRLQPIGEPDGTLWVNDSKATNVSATTVALRAFDRPVVLILGGRHKGEAYTSLLPEIQRHVRAIVALGEAAPQIVADLQGSGVTIRVEGGMDSAVRAADGLAREGDVVLLSPACSSYDMFPDYQERGRAFEKAMRKLPDAAGRPA